MVVTGYTFDAEMNTNLLHADFNCFRFLTADRMRPYLCILLALFHERQAYQIEIFHDDLYNRVAPDLDALMGSEYVDVQFRQDIDQLVDWGNIQRKLEGRRIRTLADNSLRRNILKISEDSFQLIRYLLSQSKPRQRKTATRGFMLLEDLSNCLDELEKLQEDFFDGKRSEPALQRACHLIQSMDEKIDEAVAELTGLADQLHSFLDTKDEFETETFAQLVSQLESYNNAYLSRLTEMAGHLFVKMKNFERHLCYDQFTQSLNEIAESAGHSANDKIALLIEFFAPGSGKLNFYCRRINAELGDAIRRIRNYMRIRQDRTLRVQEIRSRIQEMFTVPDDQACAWIERLYSTVSVPTLACDGTPVDRSLAPRPRKYVRRISAWQTSQPIGKKAMSLEASRELERLKIEKLNQFFSEKILRNQPENQLQNSLLESLEDIKNLMSGVKLALIKSSRKNSRFDMKIEKPPADAPKAQKSAPDFDFSCPNHIVRKKT